MASKPIYQFYAELDGYKPVLWRRFQVAGNITIARLAYIVMTLFEMKASHLFAVEVPWAENFRKDLRKENRSEEDFEKLSVGIPPVWRYEMLDHEQNDFDDLEDVKVLDATKHTLSRVIEHVGDELSLNYDFGDNWYVSLVVESITTDAALPGKELPRVFEGEGFGIIEDCGGVFGLEELRKAFIKKKGDSYKELREWLGVDELDMSTFDIDDMNFRLKKLPRIYKECYEDRLTPTRRSINLIERKYRK